MGFFSFRRQKDATEDSAFSTRGTEGAEATRGRASKRLKESEPVDPVLPEKQRARRRLVGAVALVLAAVIGLPMILDPEPKPLAHDIAIDIPSSKDKSKQAGSVPLSASLDDREEVIGASAATGAATGNVVATPGEVPASQPATAQKPEPSQAQKTGATAATTAVATAAAAATAAKTAPGAANAKPVTPSTSADEARARALLDGKAVPAMEKLKAGSEKPERYVVQVAALASAEKVQELQNKLKAAGMKSHTQKVATQSGERIRVRVGPVQGKAEAEKIRAKLSKLGLNGTLVPA